jgi:hypothetical protein
VKKVSDASFLGLLQDVIPDRLRATTRNVRRNFKFCDSVCVTDVSAYSMFDIFFVVCLQSVPDPGVEARSYRNVSGRQDKR